MHRRRCISALHSLEVRSVCELLKVLRDFVHSHGPTQLLGPAGSAHTTNVEEKGPPCLS